MAFLKFWGKKGKGRDDADLKKEEALADPEAEKRRLRHSLSISRSGRFKQKKRDRGGILDKPDLYGAEQEDKEQSGYSETSSSTSTSSAMSSSSKTTSTSSRSPKTYHHEAHGRQESRHAGSSIVT